MLARIAAVRDQIRPSERKLADYAIAHPGDVINLSMAELAERAGVSEPTVARFCSALGCRGFREFKIKLAQDIAGGMPFLHQELSVGGELDGAAPLKNCGNGWVHSEAEPSAAAASGMKGL